MYSGAYIANGKIAVGKYNGCLEMLLLPIVSKKGKKVE